jgi:hypothetical protein
MAVKEHKRGGNPPLTRRKSTPSAAEILFRRVHP